MACVLGADRARATDLEQLVRDYTPLEVERLPLHPRAMSRLSRGAFRLIVLDAEETDPLAYCNEVYRRLSGPGRRQVPLVICIGAGQTLRPPLRRLADRPNTRVLDRPPGPAQLLEAIGGALGWTLHAEISA